jgi:ABC-2 type transport system ATP-binding protein
MTQRVALASALLHDPDLLILDEPTSGLDPRGRVEVREIIKSLKKNGKTIFMSTHLLGETQELCDAVALLDKGKLLHVDAVQDIARARSAGKVRIEFLEIPSGPQIDLIKKWDRVVSLQREPGQSDIVVELEGGLEARAEFLGKLNEAGFKIISFRTAENTLESFYLNLMPESVD